MDGTLPSAVTISITGCKLAISFLKSTFLKRHGIFNYSGDIMVVSEKRKTTPASSKAVMKAPRLYPSSQPDWSLSPRHVWFLSQADLEHLSVTIYF
jgi:hypothetical protein